MTDEELTALVEQIIVVAESLIREALIPLIIAAAQELFAPGGAIHSQILADSLSEASNWYGMYAPKKYVRGMTFTNPGNIAISADGISSDGYSWSGAWNATNMSPHAGWSDGFPLRGGGSRPGGYIVSHDKHFTATITVAAGAVQGIVDQCVQQAIAQCI